MYGNKQRQDYDFSLKDKSRVVIIDLLAISTKEPGSNVNTLLHTKLD